MSRHRRLIDRYSLQHVVSAFLSREFRFDAPGARAEFLARLARALKRTDWTGIAWCLMSSHLHLCLLAGDDPLEAVMRPLNGGFAAWLNRAENRRGYVFEDRPWSAAFLAELALELIAYLHLNPVRAGVVKHAADSPWTSHRAYLDLVEPPPWLDVEYALDLCGFSGSPSGRVAFDQAVAQRASQPRAPFFSGPDRDAERAARAALDCTADLGTPTVRQVGATLRLDLPLIAPTHGFVCERWTGSAEEIVALVARSTGLELGALLGRTKNRRISLARTIALVLWTLELHRPAAEMQRVLGIARSSASKALTAASPPAKAAAAELARFLRQASAVGSEQANSVP